MKGEEAEQKKKGGFQFQGGVKAEKRESFLPHPRRKKGGGRKKKCPL